MTAGSPESDPAAWNQRAWNAQVERGNRWTQPVDAAAVQAARGGNWSIVLTPDLPVPRRWFPERLASTRLLLLAGGGGQQGPILSAAGAQVTVFDNSPAQLEQDRKVAAREGLEIDTVQGDMRDLAVFADASFDLIVHPCSNTFIPEVEPVWREAHRVLVPGGRLMAGFLQPAFWIFDDAASLKGELVVRHALPYADQTHLTAEELAAFQADDEPLCFGHTFDSLLAGQCRAGLLIEDLFEDIGVEKYPINRFLKTSMATLARKPALDLA